MAEQGIHIRKTRPDEGGCNLCPVIMRRGEPVTLAGETTISVGQQQSRLCRGHLILFERAIRRWRKNLPK